MNLMKRLGSVRLKKHKVGRYLVLFTVLLSAVLALTYITAAAADARIGTITSNGGAVNVRSGPGTNNALLGTLAYGTTVVITGEATDSNSALWYKISYNSGDGYVIGTYISNIRNVETSGQFDYTYGVVNSSSLNVRNGPGTSFSVLRTLSNGAKLSILDTVTGTDNETWYFIRTSSGIQGYVYGPYVTTATATIYYDPAFEVYMTEQNFPESYKNNLRILHSLYPNWKFVAVNTGLNWSDVISAESRLTYSLVTGSSISSWKSTQDGAYNWSTSTWNSLDSGGWVQASRGMVEYYMDPRNFMSTESIFQFLCHSFDSSLSEATIKNGLRTMLLGTFMYPNSSTETVTHTYGGSINYINTLYDTGVSYDVNPYVLAAMILQEQGSSGSSGSISGNNSVFPGIYNYFNVGAYLTSTYDAVTQGLYYATGSGQGYTTYGRPWDTRSESIMGGADYYTTNFTDNGQNTQYLKKFNVCASNSSKLYTNQYMTNIQGAASEGCSLATAYSESMRGNQLTFYIPVYSNMPDSTVMPLVDGSPNNKLSSLTVNSYSLTPAFSQDSNSYQLVVENSVASVSISASVYDSTATISVNGQPVASGGAVLVNLVEGSNTVNINVTAQNCDERCYVIAIARQIDPSGIGFSSSIYKISASGTIAGIQPPTTAATLLSGFTYGSGATIHVFSITGTEKAGSEVIVTGDVLNVYAGDGSLYKSYSIVIYGDVTGDGKISIYDLIKIRNVISLTDTITGAFATAGDVNKSGSVTITDLIGVRNQITGYALIQQ